MMTAPVFARPKENVVFDPNRFAPKPLFESPEMKVIRAAFRAGQFIPIHKPDVHVVLYILSGRGGGRGGREAATGQGRGSRRRPAEGGPRRKGEDRHGRPPRRISAAHEGRPRRHGGKNRPGGFRTARLTRRLILQGRQERCFFREGKQCAGGNARRDTTVRST